MQGIRTISEMLNQRLDLLEALLLLSSFREILETEPQKMILRHSQISGKEKELTVLFIRSIRVDDRFRRQFHKLSLDIFRKLESRWTLRRDTYGKFREIVADYVSFFDLLKEAYIIEFLSQTFRLSLYSNTTGLFILLETFCKYLRVKTEGIIKKIESKTGESKERQVKSTNLKSSSRIGLSEKLLCSRRALRTVVPRERMHNTEFVLENLSRLENNPNSQNDNKYVTLYSRLKTDDLQMKRTPKGRKIIRSFRKDILQSRFEVKSTSLLESHVSSGNYLKTFIEIFSQEWKLYCQMLTIPNLDKEFRRKAVCKASKEEWVANKMKKAVAEMCQRNGSARRQLDRWNDRYAFSECKLRN